MPKPVAFQLLPAAQYYHELAAALAKAKRRIAIHAMLVAWTPGMDQLVPLIRAAQKRGVSVDIVGDYYTRIYLSLWSPFSRKAGEAGTWQRTKTINDKLAANGATVSYIGKIKPLNPFAGRCHSKITVVDDRIFSFGGVNFGDQDLRGDMPNLDFMLSARDKALADYLHQLVRTMGQDTGVLPDYQHAIDPQTTVLFDGGKPSESIIYDTVCRIAANATSLYYVSQWPPSGRLGYIVAQKQSACYFNRVGQGNFPHNLQSLVGKIRYPSLNRYTKTPYLHAKFLLAQDADGSKHLITGSNNFSWSGVQFGTKEVAIYSTNEELWQALYEYLENTIA